jgi:lysophospholipase L1-like esterase
MTDLHLLFLSLLLFLACMEDKNQPDANPTTEGQTRDTITLSPNRNPIDTTPIDSTNHPSDSSTYLALGDSYTIGESVKETDRWGVQLAQLLKNAEINISSPDIIARTGWTTAELLEAIEANGNTKKYTIVSLLIGVNNQYRGQTTERYAQEFRKLLEISINYADGDPSKVFVLSIPDWGVTPAGESRSAEIALQIDNFNQVGKYECALKKITFIDITEISRKARDNAQFIASDHLHFSGSMYNLWALEAFPVVKKMLEK